MDTCLTNSPTVWPAAASLLDAISRRDFPALLGCLDPDVQLRALVPPGPLAVDGAEAVVATFVRWFGGDDAFEVVDAALGQIGGRMYARWRVRLWATDEPAQGRVAEQHVFTSGDDRIRAIDLLCSGFQPVGAA